MLHTVDLAAFLRLAADPSRRRRHLAGRHRQQAYVLLIRLERPGRQLYVLDRCTLFCGKRNQILVIARGRAFVIWFFLRLDYGWTAFIWLV